MHSDKIQTYISDLQQATDKITSWLSELQHRASEIDLFFEKGDLLQAALTPEKAYAVISQLAKELFPAESGVLYLRTPSQSHNRIEAVATWGNLTREESGFDADDCWALRSGRVYLVDASSPVDMLCEHVDSPAPGGSLCVPMMAHGEAIGVLHLRGSARGKSKSDGAKGCLSPAKQRLAVAVGGHIAMAIANLRLRELLSNQANVDPLTGLYNRRHLDEAFPRELRRAARAKRTVGLILFDIDHFKRYNTNYGHPGGDAVLRALGQLLQKKFVRREGDIASRFGGEEFALVLPEAPLEVTLRRAEDLREEVKRLDVSYESRSLGEISISLGVAVFPDHGSSAEDLIRAADLALYRAKDAGRDRVEVARSSDHE